jgi:hypothetical protein
MAVADRQTRITGPTRLHVSITVRTQSRLPSNVSSNIQSIAQTLFGLVASLRSLWRFAMTRRRGGFNRIWSPSRLYNRLTRFTFISQHSRRNRMWMRLQP